MPFKQFDRSKIQLKPLSQRVHDVHMEQMNYEGKVLDTCNPTYGILGERMRQASNKKSTILMMYGAHVIRTGNAPYMIQLMQEGLITHFATNGAGAIHDFELSMIGATCESVAKYISKGQFGLWEETTRFNDAMNQGVEDGLGFGEAIGRYIWENEFPNRESSVLAMAYHLQVPATVHIGIGNDIVHEYENFNPALAGTGSYRDFLIYTESITRLEGGVFLNVGSAVTGPEVYLKALAMARNVANQEGKQICNFTTAVFDMQKIGTSDFSKEADKSNPSYYFRPWKTILTRTVADGGESYYIEGSHDVTIPTLYEELLGKK
ncbi:MAG: hypothetical protein R3Y67_00365 [Eubacteriales bacterium]